MQQSNGCILKCYRELEQRAQLKVVQKIYFCFKNVIFLVLVYNLFLLFCVICLLCFVLLSIFLNKVTFLKMDKLQGEK